MNCRVMVAELVKAGLTYADIGRQIGVSRERVRQIAKKLGLILARPKKSLEAKRLVDRTYSKTDLSLERLRQLLTYEPDTGLWRWRVMSGRRKDPAGSRSEAGYIQNRIDGKLYMAHILAWFHIHERWPKNHIDHDNLDPSDNRLSNLRLATQSQNLGNCEKRKSNTSGFKGVHFDKFTGKWRAEIAHIKLGCFETREQAAEAYETAARIRYGVFARI